MSLERLARSHGTISSLMSSLQAQEHQRSDALSQLGNRLQDLFKSQYESAARLASDIASATQHQAPSLSSTLTAHHLNLLDDGTESLHASELSLNTRINEALASSSGSPARPSGLRDTALPPSSSSALSPALQRKAPQPHAPPSPLRPSQQSRTSAHAQTASALRKEGGDVLGVGGGGGGGGLGIGGHATSSSNVHPTSMPRYSSSTYSDLVDRAQRNLGQLHDLLGSQGAPSETSGN